MLSLSCWAQIFSSCGKPGLLFLAVRRLLIVVAFSFFSLLWNTGSRHMGLVPPWHVEPSQTRDRTHVPCISRRIPIHCSTREVLAHPWLTLLPSLTQCSMSPGLHSTPWDLHSQGHLLNSSVQFSHSVMSNSLWPHESQHARPPCPSPTTGAYPNSCPSSRWCHPTISSSVVPFSSCPQSFPASGSFPMSQLFTSGGQSIGVSASTSVLSMNTEDWSPLGWTGWIFLQSKGLSRVFSNTTVQKHQFFGGQLSLQSNSHIHTWPLKNHSLD